MRTVEPTTQTLIDRIRADWKQARKDRDHKKAGILGFLIGAIDAVGKDNGQRPTTDAEAIQVIFKFQKDLKTTFGEFTKMPMEEFNYIQAIPLPDDIQKAVDMIQENEIYTSYLPKQLSVSELVDIINEGTSMGLNHKGQFMGHLSRNYKGQYDGKMASGLVDEILQAQKEL